MKCLLLMPLLLEMYFNTNDTAFKNFNFYFKPRSGSPKYLFDIRKLEAATIIYENIKFIEPNRLNESGTVFQSLSSRFLYPDASEENGNRKQI